MFGIDLETREFVWLNVARGSEAIVAGATSLACLLDYFDVTKKMNVYRFFEWMATELVTDPAEADVIVTDSREIWEQANAGCNATADGQKNVGSNVTADGQKNVGSNVTADGQKNVGSNITADGQIKLGELENAGEKEVTSDTEVASDKKNAGENSKEWIHSYDFEKLLALMNQ